MSDEIDRANEEAQNDLERRIAAARGIVTPPRPLPTECDNGCGAEPRERSRYCSMDCREDHERRTLIARRTRAA